MNTCALARAAALLIGFSFASLVAPASAQTTETLRIATIPSDIAGEVYYAQDMGFFAKAGLTVEITPIRDGGTIASAVSAHAMDIGYTGVFEVLNGRNKGLDLTILTAANKHVTAAPTAALLGVNADSPIKSAKDFNGKTIGVNPLRGGTYIATRAWLDKNGGDSSSVKFIEIPLPLMADAVKANRIDAAAFDALAVPNLGKPGNEFRVIACTFDGIAPEFTPSAFITTDSWIAKHPTESKKFVEVMRQTAAWANTHHSESAQILAKYTKLTVPQLQAATRVTYGTEETPAQIQPFIDAAVKYGVVPNATPGKELISAAASAR